MAGRLARRVYASSRWTLVRRLVLDGASWSCALCHGYANEVHHKKPVEDGGAWFAIDNLIAICRSCHFAAHKKRRPQDQRTIRDKTGWRRLLASVTT